MTLRVKLYCLDGRQLNQQNLLYHILHCDVSFQFAANSKIWKRWISYIADHLVLHPQVNQIFFVWLHFCFIIVNYCLKNYSWLKSLFLSYCTARGHWNLTVMHTNCFKYILTSKGFYLLFYLCDLISVSWKHLHKNGRHECQVCINSHVKTFLHSHRYTQANTITLMFTGVRTHSQMAWEIRKHSQPSANLQDICNDLEELVAS